MRERGGMDDGTSGKGWAAVARRWGVDAAVFAAVGLLMGFIGPFGTDRAPVGQQYAYWMICMVGGGLIGVTVDESLRRRLTGAWARTAVVSLVMTPPTTLLVLYAELWVMSGRGTLAAYVQLIGQVWPIALATMAVRALVWRRGPATIQTRTVIAPPLPEAESVFRRRLSARRRGARLIAVEAHDHYLKVHTDAGIELIALRFADALEELSHAHGWRTHRSWWVAAEAVESVRWRRGVGELSLAGGLAAPVSRTYRPVLKEAGWG
jgi:hypothetical protein